jgi:choice-of-anchor A domain-containing protein
MNFGYGFSKAMHDSNLGESHYGQDGSCFPRVQIQGNPPGYDDAVSFLVGGNYTGKNGAEVEGNMIILGDLIMSQNGPSNLVTVGFGSQIIPHKNGVAIKVGGSMSSPKQIEICRQITSPFYPCKVVVKGERNNYNTIAPSWMRSDGFEYVQDSNLDLSAYEEQVDILRAKSEYWGSLASTQGASSGVSSQAFKIECTNDNVVQVFNIEASSLRGQGYSSYIFNENCSDKSVLIDVQGGGRITMKTKQIKWMQNGQVKSAGW